MCDEGPECPTFMVLPQQYNRTKKEGKINNNNNNDNNQTPIIQYYIKQANKQGLILKGFLNAAKTTAEKRSSSSCSRIYE